jgi:hypothetical protein
MCADSFAHAFVPCRAKVHRAGSHTLGRALLGSLQAQLAARLPAVFEAALPALATTPAAAAGC